MIKYLLLAGLLTSCSTYPIKRSHSTIDKTEKCMYRLVEKNGISATEAEKVCSRVFRRNYDNIGIKR